MSHDEPANGGRSPQHRQPLRSRLLRARYWVYGAVLIALVAFRVLPGIRAQLARRSSSARSSHTLILSGLELAPVLIPRLVETYRQLYPDLDIRILGGGTRQALEDMFNGRADVAFTSRPMTPDEQAVVHAVGDTALSFPIALGGIAILASHRIGIDSLRVEELREIMQGKVPGRIASSTGALHVYSPDPNLGLWTALTTQLGLPDTTGAPVTWLAGDGEVLQAVAADPASVGLASTLALPAPADLDRMGIQTLPVYGEKETQAARPNEGAVAVGEYPLYHYLYVSCRPEGGAVASGFVSFLYSGRGQRLVEREGFLPAREVPREIQLSSKPFIKVG